MTAAIVNVCFDPRLDHDAIRLQTQALLRAKQVQVQRIFITNEAGGNFGSSLRNAINLLGASGETIAFIGVLDHDDCQAAAAGVREPLAQRVAAVSDHAAQRKINCPVTGGSITSSGNVVTWED